MGPSARRALAGIRGCVASGRYRVLAHFVQRMDQRGLFWPDVQTVLDRPADVRAAGRDDWNREKWIIAGNTTSGQNVELVCVLDVDEDGEFVLFVTAYWTEP